jgi:hypothetical protein
MKPITAPRRHRSCCSCRGVYFEKRFDITSQAMAAPALLLSRRRCAMRLVAPGVVDGEKLRTLKACSISTAMSDRGFWGICLKSLAELPQPELRTLWPRKLQWDPRLASSKAVGVSSPAFPRSRADRKSARECGRAIAARRSDLDLTRSHPFPAPGSGDALPSLAGHLTSYCVRRAPSLPLPCRIYIPARPLGRLLLRSSSSTKFRSSASHARR